MTNEEERMANAEMLKVTHIINKKVETVEEKVQILIDGAHYCVQLVLNIILTLNLFFFFFF
jgi:hypothetical protein